MKTKILDFLYKNLIILAYLSISLILEFSGVFLSSGKFYISEPLIYLTLLAIGCTILFAVRAQKARFIVSLCFIFFNVLCDVVFLTIFAMTSGTIFDFSMAQLSQDGVGIIEKIVINFSYLTIATLLCGLYFIIFRHIKDRLPKPKSFNYNAIVTISLAAVFCTLQGFSAFSSSYAKKADVTYLLYKNTENNYSEKGIVGNFINEMYKSVFFPSVELGDEKELKNFIYEKTSEPTEMFGKAKDYNVIFVLCESFEWFSFIADNNRYPNGHTADEATLRKIFPNLYELYDSSVTLTNYYSREKTDISENYTIIGNYPTEQYINYAFPHNSLPYSLPNVLNNLSNVESNSFHNGEPNFYNRTEFLTNAAGFKSFTARDKMNVTDYTVLGERNLDSEMINACKKEMFPTDKRFSTYITTITGHGQYTERQNLKEYYKILDENNICPVASKNDKNKEMIDTFRYYTATSMELDKAIGEINSYLKANNIYDNTILTIYGDHNAYYNGFSNYVKDLNDTDTTRNYNELFRVPLMMRVGNQKGQKIDKFTTNSDILPTIYDLLGIKYFSNLLYGHSVFSDDVSVLYSRAYEIFITEKLYFYSLKQIIYKAPDTTTDYIKDIEINATTLLNKISHINRIFYNDYFQGENENYFNAQMKLINA